MLHRRPFLRPLLGIALVGAGLVGVVGGLSLRGPGLVAVGVAGALAGCLGWGMARESAGTSRRSTTETAVLAAAWTIGGLLVLSGTSVLAGGLAAALLAGAAATIALVVWVARTPADDAAAGAPTMPPAPTASGNLAAAPETLAHPVLRSSDEPPPVTVLGTDALGQEWLQSTAALAGPLDPRVRSALVRRRQETLDELERRDPDGFLRWLTAGPTPVLDPAAYVRGRTAGESTSDPA